MLLHLSGQQSRPSIAHEKWQTHLQTQSPAEMICDHLSHTGSTLPESVGSRLAGGKSDKSVSVCKTVCVLVLGSMSSNFL